MTNNLKTTPLQEGFAQSEPENSMFDAEKQALLRGGGQSGPPKLSDLSPRELRTLKHEIEALLPKESTNLGALDLEAELVSQYDKTKNLMDDVLHDEDTPANQKAQVANSVVATLAQLVKLQEDLRREQTLKIMEQVLVDVIKTLPEETKAAFFEEYERQAKKAGLI